MDHSELGRRNIVRNSQIGKGSYTGTNTILKNTEIGNYCCIGWNVSVGGGNHNINNVSMYTDYWYKRTFGIVFNKDIDGSNEVAEKVIIGNDVWIGAGVNIINGVKIGDGAVIGAGAIVTRDVSPYSVVVGIPAKEIKKRFDDEIIELLLKLQWWDWSEDKIRDNVYILRNKPSIDILKNFFEE
ncbi:MAG: CatB-related O-acetyltransferase [Clostridia bacterium]|nr:CatB-related O-acetyltransferase [Clostridia bacterium]